MVHLQLLDRVPLGRNICNRHSNFLSFHFEIIHKLHTRSYTWNRGANWMLFFTDNFLCFKSKDNNVIGVGEVSIWLKRLKSAKRVLTFTWNFLQQANDCVSSLILKNSIGWQVDEKQDINSFMTEVPII